MVGSDGALALDVETASLKVGEVMRVRETALWRCITDLLLRKKYYGSHAVPSTGGAYHRRFLLHFPRPHGEWGLVLGEHGHLGVAMAPVILLRQGRSNTAEAEWGFAVGSGVLRCG